MRRLRRQGESQFAGHITGREFSGGRLQGPRLMLDFATIKTASGIGGEQSVPFSEPMFQTAGLASKDITDRPVIHLQHGSSSAPMRPVTLISDPVAPQFAVHPGIKIREMKSDPSSTHCQPGRRIQTEKPNPRAAAADDVRPDIELRKRSGSGQTRHAGQPNIRHSERHDPNPGFTIPQIKFPRRIRPRQERPQRFRIHAPMGEQQIAPGHPERWKPRDPAGIVHPPDAYEPFTSKQ